MRKPTADLAVVNASEVVTLAGDNTKPRVGPSLLELGIIKGGAVACSGGRISWVGKNEKLREARNITSSTLILDARGKTVMPGFVDSHTHLIFSGSREMELQMKLAGKSYLEILQAGNGILRTVRETRSAPDERLRGETRRRLRRLIENGTTCAEVKSGYGLTTKDEIKLLRIIKSLRHDSVDLVPTFLGAHAVPPEYDGKANTYVDLIVQEMLPAIRRRGLAQFCDAFCESGVFDADQCRRILTSAKRLGFEVKLHADEFSDSGGARLAAEVKAVSADHLLYSSAEGIRHMAQEGVIATLLPVTPFANFLDRYANARRIIDAGCAVAIATDLSPSSWTESMQFAISLACFKMKMRPAEALVAATINGAHALRKAGEVGSLEVGKKADIIVIDAPNHAFLPYHFGVNLVDSVVKDGSLLVENGRFLA